MSRGKLQHEARRWFQTAVEDLGAVEDLHRTGHHAQSCFYCRQAAEKALKALWFSVDADPWGHSVLRMVRDLPDDALRSGLAEILEAAAGLDMFYIPTRYPNGLPDLTPGQVYSENESANAIRTARTIVSKVGDFLAQSGAGEL